MSALMSALLVSVAVSCTEINASTDHVAALEFTVLPAPAVVAGDTLRDSLGVAAPLRAIAFNGAGDTVANAAIQYIALDTGLTISAAGLVVAQRRSGSVPIVASADALQTKPVSLLIARTPDSVAAVGKVRDTVNYVVPDVASTNTSTAMAVKVLTRDTTDGITTTQGWVVSYQAFYRGSAVSAGDTAAVFLVGDGTQRTWLDTTGTDGTASRRLRVRPIGITTSATDSVIVLATVRYQGAAIRGSPVRFVILIRPKPVAGSG
jgi:hypothetical protein